MNIRRQNGNFNLEEDPFSKNVPGIGKFYPEVFLLIKLLQTKPQIRSMNYNFYDLFYTVIKNRDDKGIVNDEIENNENDFINFNDFNIPNRYIRRQNYSQTLK